MTWFAGRFSLSGLPNKLRAHQELFERTGSIRGCDQGYQRGNAGHSDNRMKFWKPAQRLSPSIANRNSH